MSKDTVVIWATSGRPALDITTRLAEIDGLEYDVRHPPRARDELPKPGTLCLYGDEVPTGCVMGLSFQLIVLPDGWFGPQEVWSLIVVDDPMLDKRTRFRPAKVTIRFLLTAPPSFIDRERQTEGA